ncbi:acyl-CoA N-acyltransferase [Rhexocercosporidium sp. MPI-PUGE-AT-0058]|nr:acyl-CoA N-acyltransferase [Rhexocercosporidium sp. MPI-PUGE-AT-0058]
MGTPFITFLGPSNLAAYDSSKRSSEQADTIPKTFLDAMEVREQVFVDEQKVPLQNEFDSNDHRSCHWVIYASINTLTDPEVKDQSGNIITRKRSTTRTTPIGTIRLVPFPHPPHPEPGSKYTFDSTQPSISTDSNQSSYINDRPTTHHDGKEPYIKLGRLALLPEFRGSGIAKMLVSAATSWMAQNPTYFNPSILEKGIERIVGEQGTGTGIGEVPVWKGLVCAHAQEQLVEVWRKWGFSLDEGMGRWEEEGIGHVGMFLRIDLENRSAS